MVCVCVCVGGGGGVRETFVVVCFFVKNSSSSLYLSIFLFLNIKFIVKDFQELLHLGF